MQVQIKETGIIEDIKIFSQEGADYTEDFCQTGASISDFEYDDEKELYLCSQEAFDFWIDHIKETNKFENMRSELKKEYGFEAVESVLASALEHVEFNDIPTYGISALKEAFPE